MSPFVGDSEMSRRMREVDWSGTALGPPDGWPAALRSTVGLVLRSQLPMYVAWGPEWRLLYNDAYAPLLGARHPDALGAPFATTWPEVWPALRPQFEEVLVHDTALYQQDFLMLLERSGYPEESYFTFSVSAVDDPETGQAGAFCACTETTDGVVGDRRLRVLGELGELGNAPDVEAACVAAADVLAAHRADVPAALLYLLTDDGSAARLVAEAGVEAGAALAPSTVELDADSSWAPILREVTGSGVATVVRGLAEVVPGERLAGVGPVDPAGGTPVDSAVVLPVRVAGRTAGALVAAAIPYLPLDEEYRSFLELVGHHVSTAATAAAAFAAQRERAEQLTEIDRAKTAFFTGISHEFRTPLTLILGPVAELRDGAPAGSLLRAELDLVHRNGQRLDRLVNRLLELSRLQAGRADVRFEPTDLAALTTDLAGVFRSAVERAGLVLHVDCPALGDPVFVDRSMWEQVVLNLLSNALKFTFTGVVGVTLRRADDRAVLQVSDTGTGIPEADLPRLFERFHRVERAAARSSEGSGIGLALVSELVALHQGTVDVQSALRLGTTVTVSLPLGRAHLPAAAIAPAGDEPRPTARSATVAEALWWLDDDEADEPAVVEPPEPADAGRILVVDDNADMRRYLVRLLSRSHRVEAVKDGSSALAAALAETPDLVLADVTMPGLDGLELLAALRQDPRTSVVPVVLMSARAGQEAAVQGISAGADDYLVKPFSARELRARVDGRLALGRARREAERRFRAMADSTPALIWADGPGGRRLFVNRGWQEFTGADADADLGLRWRERIHPADRERYAAARAGAAGGPFEVEYRLRAADGTHRWVLDRGAPAEGYVGGYVGGCLDIHTRVVERERQRLLAVVGAALDRETTLAGRRATLVRAVVDEGVVDVARFVELGETVRPGAAAARTVDEEALLVELEDDWGAVGEISPAEGPVRVEVDPGWVQAGTTERQQEVRRRLDPNSVVLVPLVARGHLSGVLVTGRTDGSAPIGGDDLALLGDLGDRAGTALDNALLLEREKAARRTAEGLGEVVGALSGATSLADVAEVVLDLAMRLGATSAEVLLRTAEQLEVLSARGPDRPPVERRLSLDAAHPVARAARTGEAVWDGGRIAVPLVVGPGRSLGVLALRFDGDAPAFSAEERTTLRTLAGQCAQALDRARLHQAEHDVAVVLQRSLLPRDLPMLPRLGLAARYLPSAVGVAAGGDWYDILPIDDLAVALVVGDVVGHGPPAAAVMGQLRSALAAYLLDGHSPAAALERLDRFAHRVPGATGSTCVCAVLDCGSGELRWSRAGHPPPLLIEASGPRYLDDGGGTVLGVAGRPPYPEAHTMIEPGCSVLLYTDGLVERRGEVLDEGQGRLADAATAAQDLPPDALVSRLVDGALGSGELGDPSQPDDVALVAVRLLPAPLRARLPAEPARLRTMRRAVDGWAGEVGLPEEVLEDLQYALGEAAANAVEHAYGGGGGEFAYALTYLPGPEAAVAVEVRDEGRWRPAPADPGHRGRGLKVLEAIGKDVQVDRGEGGTTVTFRIPVTPVVATLSSVPRAASSREPAGPCVVTSGPPVVRVVGDLDLDGASAVRAGLLDTVVRDVEELAVDLTEVGYASSAGIALLAEMAALAVEREVRLSFRVAPESPLARMLELSGLRAVLPVVPA